MDLESLMPYRIISGKRVRGSLGHIPEQSTRIFGYYIIKADDAKRVIDLENGFRKLIKSAIRAAEEAKMRVSYQIHASVGHH